MNTKQVSDMKPKVGNLNYGAFKVLPHRIAVGFMFVRIASKQMHCRQTAQKCKMFMDDFIRIVRPDAMQFWIITAEVFAAECFLC